MALIIGACLNPLCNPAILSSQLEKKVLSPVIQNVTIFGIPCIVQITFFWRINNWRLLRSRTIRSGALSRTWKPLSIIGILTSVQQSSMLMMLLLIVWCFKILSTTGTLASVQLSNMLWCIAVPVSLLIGCCCCWLCYFCCWCLTILSIIGIPTSVQLSSMLMLLVLVMLFLLLVFKSSVFFWDWAPAVKYTDAVGAV